MPCAMMGAVGQQARRLAGATHGIPAKGLPSRRAALGAALDVSPGPVYQHLLRPQRDRSPSFVVTASQSSTPLTPPPAEAASPADRQALDVVTLPPADPVRGASRSPHAPRSGRRTICTRRYPPIQSLGRDCGGVFSCPPGANARLDLRAACLQPTAASAALKRIICVPMHIYPTLQRKAFGQRASSPCARLSSTLRFCVRASSVRAAPLPEWVEPEASPAERESIHSKPMPALSAAVRPSIQH